MSLAPALRQFSQFKAQYPGFLLLFKMGDYYEAFHDDARTLSRVVGTSLTESSGVPLAGVPVDAVETHLRKLIAAGHRVALCEQAA
jgi:DNA mismatch repair protein MutS